MVTRQLLRLQHTSAAHTSYVVRIPNANVYRFGDPDGARPVLRAVDWTVREGESWAVVGSGAGEKTALLEVSERELSILPTSLRFLPCPAEHASRLHTTRRPFLGTCGYPPLLLAGLCPRCR
jgi:ABC-type transport system involved in cytochrome bd biosynthesis fused ATPase/permease subunit